MRNAKYEDLIWVLGSKDWRFRNELRIQLCNKKKEIVNLQTSLATGNISYVNHKIKTFILNQEKDLLVKLFKKEDSRVNKL